MRSPLALLLILCLFVTAIFRASLMLGDEDPGLPTTYDSSSWSSSSTRWPECVCSYRALPEPEGCRAPDLWGGPLNCFTTRDKRC